MASLGDVFLRLRSDDSQYRKEVVEQGKQAGTKAGDAAGETMSQRIGSQLKKHSTLIATSAGAALGTFVAGAAQDFAKFEQQMNEVRTLLPDITDSAFKDMQNDVKDFSNEFGKLPEDVIPALYQSISAGVEQGNVFDFLEVANQAAVGGVTDLETAVDGLTSATNAWGTENLSAEQAADSMFTAVRLGKTTFGELSDFMFQVGPLAAALGVDFDEVNAAIATLTAQGTPTRVATTQMKQALSDLSREGSKTDKAFKDIAGQSFPAFIEQGGGLEGALILIEEAAAKNGKTMLDLFGSIEGGQAILGLTGENFESFGENLDEFENKTGAATKAFETMDQGVQATANRIAARLKTFAIGIGEYLAPVGPILTAFGSTIGKALGGAFGAGFGFLVTRIPALMAPVLAKITATVTASAFGQTLLNNMGHPSFLNRLRGLGGGWGKALGIGAVAVLGTIIAAELAKLNEVIAANREQQQAITAAQQEMLDEGLSREEAQEQLDNLRSVREGLEGAAGAVYDLSAATEGIAGVGNLMDFLAGGEDVATFNQDRIRALEEYLASDLPETLQGSAKEGGEKVAEAVAEGVEEQEENIAAITEDLIARGILAPLEDGTPAVTQTLDEILEDGARAIEAGERRLTDVFAGLGEDGAIAMRDAIRGKTPIAEAFESFPEEMRTAMADLVPVVKEQMRTARREARHEASLMGVSFREGIKQSKSVVKNAMEDLKWAMLNPIKGVKAVMKIEGALQSKQLRNGLRSGDPFIRAQALRTRAQLVEEWEAMTGEAWDHGKSTSENIGKGIKARRRQARREARKTKNAVTEETAAAAEQQEETGVSIVDNLISGIRSMMENLRNIAGRIGEIISNNTKPGSPTKEGPLSKEGGLEVWGRALAEDFGKGLSSGRWDAASALGLRSFNQRSADLSTAATMRPGDRPGGDTTINLETHGLPMRAKTPQEVAQQLRRAARMGVITPKRPRGVFAE